MSPNITSGRNTDNDSHALRPYVVVNVSLSGKR